jgi:hypothetical protein
MTLRVPSGGARVGRGAEMTFKQCAAVKPNGEQCRRMASEGSQYCHSHREYGPKGPSPSVRLQHHYFSCSDCGRLIGPDRKYANLNTGLILCEPCYRLRTQVEARIEELVVGHKGISIEAVIEDLARFGVPLEMTGAAIERMAADGRLVLRDA